MSASKRRIASRWIARALVATLALLAGACGLNRPLARQAVSLVAQERPGDLDCDRADHCAIASPYADLADRARREDRADAPAHYVDVLEQGEESLALRIHLIRAAKKSIDIQTFIWAEDDAGWLVLDELVAAARRGVKVRILSDQLFSLDDVEWLSRIARAHENLEFRLYNPTFDEAVTQPVEFAAGVLCCFSRFNQRMHNKLFLVDGAIGIAGGRNYENRYFDWDQTFDYRDRDVLVVGPRSGAQMQASFDRFWTHPRAVPLTRLNDVNRRIVEDGISHKPLRAPDSVDLARIDALRARARRGGDARARRSRAARRPRRLLLRRAGQGRPRGRSRAAGVDLAHQRPARPRAARVVLETPYLVLSGKARKVFRSLHKRAPPVRVIVSTNSLAATDAFYVYALSYKYKKRYLRRYGFEIHEFKPFPADAGDFIADYDALSGGEHGGRYKRYAQAPLKRGGVRLGLHAKSLVIDGAIAIIGSHNFDPRSDDYNTESGFIIDDAAVAARVRGAVLRNAEPQNAWTIAPRERSGVLARVNEAISDVSTALPLFDLWPFRYASSFKPGCAPSLPGDADFYACHVDVGDFPEVDLPLKTIYTRIVTAFGAGLVGIL
jgi:phosphatidylserine/phosphatidylglycerophosphate/cardiolipin synthase-like enzyme